MYLDQVDICDVDFSGRPENYWTAHESRLERCRFEGIKATYFCFGAGMGMSEYVDCSFDGSRINALNPGNARFGRCSFRNVRLTKMDPRPSPRTSASTASRNWGAFNRYEKLPQGDGHLLLEEADPVLVAALSRVDSWPESPENKEVRSHLESKLESYVLRGQRQLLISPHDFTSRDGVKERAFARLTEVLTGVLADRAAADPSDVAEADTRLRTMRRAVRGHPFVYFRAADVDAAMRAVDYPYGLFCQLVLDAVDGAGIEPFYVLGELLALIRDTRWNPDLVPYASPTSLLELGVEVRDTLAAVDDDRLMDIATTWARTDDLSQFSDTTPKTVHLLVTDLVTLARRARETNTRLYCWSDSDQRRLG